MLLIGVTFDVFVNGEIKTLGPDYLYESWGSVSFKISLFPDIEFSYFFVFWSFFAVFKSSGRVILIKVHFC